MATPATPGRRSRSIQTKYVIFLAFAAMMVIVWVTRDRFLLQPNSFLRQRYSPIAPLMFLHGIPGALALFLGIFQFSSRLRARFLQVHRAMGRVYVGCVAIAAPAAVVVAIKLPVPTLAAASTIQALGWILATGTALYCIRTGRISQHREWMIRSYPFAAVFVFVRAIIVIPAVARAGAMGLVGTVWTAIAVACFLPSFMIAWQHLAASKRPRSPRTA